MGGFNKNTALLLLAVIIAVWSAVGTGFNLLLFLDFRNSLDFLARSWPPDWSVLRPAVSAIAETLQIAYLGTLLALILALPLSFLAAWNTAPNGIIYNGVRSVLSFIRAVPEIVFALIFVPTVSLGAMAGVLAITLHNLGVLGKLIAELVEAAERGPQEAVAASGAPGILVATHGILPQILPNVLSHAFYRMEVSVRSVLVLGFVGAGGIGQQLFIHFRMFQYEKVFVDVLAIMALVVLIDYLGAFVRSRVI
ncbi:phosphonate ABC transporter, permease protein PhnE [Dethiobacter alkaliphilus]|uniref:phosphonate ABC transporter, permease protein PhnE n=1 Tax=Dethiobacter alkaliphilus TaxID=427926 RepID=UPI002227FCC3|nr:phosphonate ABC transporter, permease protein PhnE [Dethiobacter alkaliphilus]MCW3491268.1 phosphonate ABC transporter, permease protein PhnE [Dethiobacter alkaliphilus]